MILAPPCCWLSYWFPCVLSFFAASSISPSDIWLEVEYHTKEVFCRSAPCPCCLLPAMRALDGRRATSWQEAVRTLRLVSTTCLRLSFFFLARLGDLRECCLTVYVCLLVHSNSIHWLLLLLHHDYHYLFNYQLSFFFEQLWALIHTHT